MGYNALRIIEKRKRVAIVAAATAIITVEVLV
jgi:hypothetical protein